MFFFKGRCFTGEVLQRVRVSKEACFKGVFYRGVLKGRFRRKVLKGGLKGKFRKGGFKKGGF